jgi:hypothetical protein
MFWMRTQKKIVTAIIVLHSFIHEHASDDEDFANFDRDPNFVPTILACLRWINFGIKLRDYGHIP